MRKRQRQLQNVTVDSVLLDSFLLVFVAAMACIDFTTIARFGCILLLFPLFGRHIKVLYHRHIPVDCFDPYGMSSVVQGADTYGNPELLSNCTIRPDLASVDSLHANHPNQKEGNDFRRCRLPSDVDLGKRPEMHGEILKHPTRRFKYDKADE